MKLLLVLILGALEAWGSTKQPVTRKPYTGAYGFYRDFNKRAAAYGTRRIFGGTAAELGQFPSICVLTDAKNNTKCSCSIVAARWAITAGHCITAKLMFLRYNTDMPSAKPGDIVAIDKIYRHPNYKVSERDEGRGMDVIELYHDIGLVKTVDDMVLAIPLAADPLKALRESNQVLRKKVTVMGFGKSDSSVRSHNSIGDQLSSVNLRLLPCARATWQHCICGLPEPGQRTRGVCSGDSGGPVILNGVQVAVTSMGPVECVTTSDPTPGATSVFTYLNNYHEIINNTIKLNGSRFNKLTMMEIPRRLNAARKNSGALSVFLVLVCVWFLQ